MEALRKAAQQALWRETVCRQSAHSAAKGNGSLSGEIKKCVDGAGSGGVRGGGGGGGGVNHCSFHPYSNTTHTFSDAHAHH